MLGPFFSPPFTPWCQNNPLLIHSKRGSTDRMVIIDLFWPLPPHFSVNGGIPREVFLGSYRKMHLPSSQDMCVLMHKTGKGCCLYSADVARAYRQLPLDPADWPLVCFTFQGSYYTDISPPFRLCWVVSHCQDLTGIITRYLNRGGSSILSYIDDFWG